MSDEKTRKATVLWLLLALAIWAGGTVYSKFFTSVSDLSQAQQQFYTQLRRQLLEAERERGQTKHWPQAEGVFPAGFQLRQHGLYINYVGEAEGLRWLVLFIEPDKRVAPEKPSPEDDEHHFLSDGTLLHVTVWTQPQDEVMPQEIVAFPAAEGWLERIRR